jgi:uncharacterized RDD family membrane protein YckC
MSATPPGDQPPGWSPPPPQPSGPAAGLEYGGFGVRVLAFLLDGIVIGVIASALGPLTGAGTIVEAGPNNIQINYGSGALSSLVGLLYFIGFWSLRGQTPGMIPLRLRVVRAADGMRPDWVASLLRYVGLILGFAAILLGVIWVAFDSRRQGWHDKLAGTFVVRDPA